MSLDLNVYCNELSDDLIPKIVKRLNQYEMTVEIHPDFSFNNQTGFLPFKFRLINPLFEILKERDLVSGFELYIDDFDLLLSARKALSPKLGFFDRLLGKKEHDVPFASPEIEKRLSDCKQLVSFIWHVGDSFELRFASLTSAILTELTGGVCCYPADNIWYDNRNIVEDAFKEVKEYEKSLKQEDVKFHEFEKW
jgi:hypothetical protein